MKKIVYEYKAKLGFKFEILFKRPIRTRIQRYRDSQNWSPNILKRSKDFLNTVKVQGKGFYWLPMWYEGQNIKYVKDVKDYAMSPEVFFLKKGGDCDDYAAFSEFMFRGIYKTYTCFLLHKNGSGHVVTIIRNLIENRFRVIDGVNIYGTFFNLKSASHHVYGDDTKSVIIMEGGE